MDILDAFGLFAVTAMLVCYALEDQSPWFILAFAERVRSNRVSAIATRILKIGDQRLTREIGLLHTSETPRRLANSRECPVYFCIEDTRYRDGTVGLELTNVGANYPFERSRKFPGIQPNSGNGDCSRFELRLQLGP